MKEIFLPTIEAMNAEGRTFKGCLYFGLMITADGPKVIEYNCRFGDPETQVVLPLLDGDLLTIMQACTNETLAQTPVKFKDSAACCVIMASDGYPGKYSGGFEITRDDDLEAEVYIAGAKITDGKLVTAGGRVLGVVSIGDTLGNAIKSAYVGVEKVHFDNAFYRKDIGKRAMAVFNDK